LTAVKTPEKFLLLIRASVSQPRYTPLRSGVRSGRVAALLRWQTQTRELEPVRTGVRRADSFAPHEPRLPPPFRSMC